MSKKQESATRVAENVTERVPEYIAPKVNSLPYKDQITPDNRMEIFPRQLENVLEEASMLTKEEQEKYAKMVDGVNKTPGKFDDEVQQLRFTDKAALELREQYRESEAMKFGDMPKVFAYEVESNLRQAMSTLLKPIVKQHELLKVNMAECNQLNEKTSKEIKRLNKVVDLDVKMRDVV